jgi:acylphosphatase
MKRLEATVYGRVQGVFFRAYTQQEARRLRLTGWVANEWRGTVKVVAEGTDAALAQFVDSLQRGSPSAHVDKVEVRWAEATGEFAHFMVR